MTTIGGPSSQAVIEDFERRDIQILAGHSAVSTTQRYIDSDGEAQRRIVALV